MTTDSNFFVLIHVLLSLVGIISGLIMAGGFMSGNDENRWINAFMLTTMLTDVTGFCFPLTTILPAHIIGAMSFAVLVLASIAFYLKGLVGLWRKVFVATSILAVYLNVFVLIAQLLAKTPPLAMLAPTPAAPAFALAQTIVLVIFIIVGWVSLNRSQ